MADLRSKHQRAKNIYKINIKRWLYPSILELPQTCSTPKKQKQKKENGDKKQNQAIIEYMNTLVSLFYLNLLLFTILFCRMPTLVAKRYLDLVFSFGCLRCLRKYHVSDNVKKK